MAPPPEYLEPTFGQRFLARLLDGLVLLLPLVVLSLTLGRAGFLLWLLLTAAYEITLVARDGQTVGKRALGIRVVSAETGAVPTVGQAVRRWLVLGGVDRLLSFLLLPRLVSVAWDIVILVLVLRPPLHRGPHDLFAGTIVTRVH
ncbi:MAG: hypothetical protein JWN67_1052 [Actinomycetia bacterium]|nr:hypothetical protein [Actinomycetes bacterium]